MEAHVEERRELLLEAIKLERRKLENELSQIVKESLGTISHEHLSYSLRALLLFFNTGKENINQLALMNGNKNKKRKTTMMVEPIEIAKPVRLESIVGGERRVTRAMSAKNRTSIANNTISTQQVPATPKFHPLLPATPVGLCKPIIPPFQAPLVPTQPSRPVRIARSTIRVIQHQDKEETPFTKDDLIPPTAKKGRMQALKAEGTNSNLLAKDVGLVSVELGDGKVFDLDITQSPRTVISKLNLGVDAIKEVKQKMQTYASQLRSFFSRLKV